MRNLLLNTCMLVMSTVAIMTFFCSHELSNQNKDIILSHKLLKNLDAGNYNVIVYLNITDEYQKEMSYRLKTVADRKLYDGQNPKHDIDLAWITSKMKEREHSLVADRLEKCDLLLSQFMSAIPYVIFVTVILMNLAICKGNQDARQNT